MKIERNLSFSTVNCDTRGLRIKSSFFNQINQLVDWKPISAIINKHYSMGTSANGEPAFDGLLLFKMSLLQTWYGLSDHEVENRINDSISFSTFCGLTMEEVAPDHSTLSRLREELTNKKVYEKLLTALNQQLEKHKIIVVKGSIVDASIINSSIKPKGEAAYQIVTHGDETPRDNKEIEANELVLDKYQTSTLTQNDDYLLVKLGTTSIQVPVKDIIYIESEKNYLKVLTERGAYNNRGTIKNVLPRLINKNFIQVHRGFLLNKNKISKILSDRVLLGDVIVPLSKKFKINLP